MQYFVIYCLILTLDLLHELDCDRINRIWDETWSETIIRLNSLNSTNNKETIRQAGTCHGYL